MTIFRTISEIPYENLKEILNAAEHFLGHKLIICLVCNKGELALKFKGRMTDDKITALLINLDPDVRFTANPEIFENYPIKYGTDFEYDSEDNTVIYTKDGVDYRIIVKGED